MSFKALFYAYVLGGLTLLPLLVCAAIAWSIYTSVPVGSLDPTKLERKNLSDESTQESNQEKEHSDQPKPRKGWLTVRRTFEEKETDGSYVNMMRSFLDSRSKDPKRSRPKDMWYVVLKGNVLYLYEDEAMTACEAAIQVSSHQVVIYPEHLLDGELFTKRNAICLKPCQPGTEKEMPSVTQEMILEGKDVDKKVEDMDVSEGKKQKEKEEPEEIERVKTEAKHEAFDFAASWFIFVRSCVEMEDWYLALVHAANYSSCSSTLEPIRPTFLPSDMNHLVFTLDEQPDVIPMRWLNALLGRLFFSFYRTQILESFIIGRLMKKLSKVKTSSFLQNISVTEVSVGNTPPTFSKPMLKDLTREGDAALEIRVMYKGEVRVTVEATAIINLGQRFKTYSVKLVLAVVLRQLDGNLLVKVKRPPTNRIWYAFTHPPELVLDVEPVVSDRQIKWGMICSTIESRLKEIINESVVLPNMDDIAFFESSQYMHRGGIWADASRKARAVPKAQEDLAKTNSSTSNSNVDALRKSQSDGVTDLNNNVSPDPDADVNITRPESIAALEMTQQRRRSWFEGAGPGDLNDGGSDDKQSSTDEPMFPEDGRGRSPITESIGRRATSVPASKTASIEDSEDAESAFSQSGSTISPDSAGLSSSANAQDPSSSSAHSRTRSLSSGARVLVTEQTNSSRESLPSRGSSSTNTSSFLSVLKSKADKQALSNTAKEAMRKWSANWSGFKRDHISGNGEESTNGIPQGNSSLFSFPTKGRNYADIRVAVTGRRDRDSVSSSEERPEGSSSAPIFIPERRNMDVNASDHVCQESTLPPQDFDGSPSSPSHLTVPQQSPPRVPSILRRDSNRSAPSPPKVTTETHATDANALHDQQQYLAQSFIPPPEPPVVAPPIKTQPSQGAKMAIPGIHASHRGDVMAYGYVPPAPSAQAMPEPKSHAAIQSMYRLFRSPTSNASIFQQQQSSTTRSPTLSTTSVGSPRIAGEPSQRLAEDNDDIAPLSLLADNASLPLRPNPPPLPPRSLASSAPPSMPPRRVAGAPSTSPHPESTVPPSSASEVLKLIAVQDETKRKDLESPEWKSRPSSKRNSLGARRITPATMSDKPESLPGASDVRHAVQQTGESLETPQEQNVVREPDTLAAEETGPRSHPGDVSPGAVAAAQPAVVADEARSRPPPLPPRRPSLPRLS